MAVIRKQDRAAGREALERWMSAARHDLEDIGFAPSADAASKRRRLDYRPDLPRSVWAMAVRYSLSLLERTAPGEGVEVRVAPWGAVKVLEGPASDPHNLTPPDVIELAPQTWMRLVTGVTTWGEERGAGRISAVGERDDLSGLLPLSE